jgi:hypothetical protein
LSSARWRSLMKIILFSAFTEDFSSEILVCAWS